MGGNHDVLELKRGPALQEWLDRERIHFNKVAIRCFPPDLVMSSRNILRYDQPSALTPFPVEYAFHLLGAVHGKTIVDLGCGDGFNTVTLAALGAKVIAVDVSDKSLGTTSDRIHANKVEDKVQLVHGDAAAIPVADGTVDGVLCAGVLRHVDCLAAARQIRRILKPGGRASFIEQVSGPSWLARLRTFFPRPAHVIAHEGPLSIRQICAVSRAVGKPGRYRKFMLTSRVLERIGIRHVPAMKKSHEMDSWILQRFAFFRPLASPLVWEAKKES